MAFPAKDAHVPGLSINKYNLAEHCLNSVFLRFQYSQYSNLIKAQSNN